MIQAIYDTVIQFLHGVEGIKTKPYKDSGGKWTIGVGHMLTQSELASGKLYLDDVEVRFWSSPMRLAEVEILLRQDLEKYIDAVLENVQRELNTNQIAALVSFAYNVGIAAFKNSTLLKVLNDEDGALSETNWDDEVAHQLTRWVYVGGEASRGLQSRRRKEIALWRTPV
jgi:lysozyme